MDTIFALASAQGKAGISVVRLSGPKAWSAVEWLCKGSLPTHRRPVLRKLWSGDEVLDEALVLTFAEGASFTGEPSVELHLHGSIAVVGSVLRALGEIESLRPAEAGEFTRRALENGRLDLTQVEGLADLIDAETMAQQRQAMRVMSGGLARRADRWRADLVRSAALIEATIDFADEDVPVDVSPEVLALIDRVSADFAKELAGSGAAERIRTGFEVAIVGVPNAGKSTLLNALAGREAAITSEFAGTTRDVIEVRMEIAGLAVTLLDTAGLRQTQDPVEQIGVARARARAEAADLRLFLLTGADDGLDIARLPGDICVVGKADLGAPDAAGVSGLTGVGLDDLIGRIGAELSQRSQGAGLLVRERHRMALARALDCLDAARSKVLQDGMAELVAADLRYAISAIEGLIGRVNVENLLDEIFASFCIGK